MNQKKGITKIHAENKLIGKSVNQFKMNMKLRFKFQTQNIKIFQKIHEKNCKCKKKNNNKNAEIHADLG